MDGLNASDLFEMYSMVVFWLNEFYTLLNECKIDS